MTREEAEEIIKGIHIRIKVKPPNLEHLTLEALKRWIKSLKRKPIIIDFY